MNIRPVRLAAVRRRRQADDRHPRRRVAEAAQRPRPVVLAAVAPRRVGRAGLAPLDQPRAAAAGVDLGRQRGERLAAAVLIGFAASPWHRTESREAAPCGAPSSPPRHRRRARRLLVATASSSPRWPLRWDGGGTTTAAARQGRRHRDPQQHPRPRAGRGRRLRRARCRKLHGADLATRPPVPRPGTGTRRRDRQGAARPRRQSRTRAEEDNRKRRADVARRDVLDFLYAGRKRRRSPRSCAPISNLTAPWPRSLLGSIAANQAQHLVVLRQALGADAAESIPKAFEDGTGLRPDPPGAGSSAVRPPRRG